MQADGANRTCFADVSSPTWSVPSVVWSPDSSQIAFDAGGVHILKSDGSGLSNLTIREGGHGPAWSPDGRRIAFATDRDGNREIYVMQADGSGQTNLTNRPYYDDSPVWSPDGKEFAFDSSRDGHREICFIGVEGGNLRCHSAESRIGSNVKVWSPTGRFIAVETQQELYVMDSQGTDPVILDGHGEFNASPTWSPDGRHILFFSEPGGCGRRIRLGPMGQGLQNSPSGLPGLIPRHPGGLPTASPLCSHPVRSTRSAQGRSMAPPSDASRWLVDLGGLGGRPQTGGPLRSRVTTETRMRFVSCGPTERA